MKRKRENDNNETYPKKRRKIDHGLENDILNIGKTLYQYPDCLTKFDSFEKLPISAKNFLTELKSYLQTKDDMMEKGIIKFDDWIIFSGGKLKLKTEDFFEAFNVCSIDGDELLLKVGSEFVGEKEVEEWKKLLEEEES